MNLRNAAAAFAALIWLSPAPAAADEFAGACAVGDLGVVAEADRARIDAKVQELIGKTGGDEQIVSLKLEAPLSAKVNEVFPVSVTVDTATIEEAFGVSGDCAVTSARTRRASDDAPLTRPFVLTATRIAPDEAEVARIEGPGFGGRLAFDAPGVYRLAVEILGERVSALNAPRRVARTIRIGGEPRGFGVTKLEIDAPFGGGTGIVFDGKNEPFGVRLGQGGVCQTTHSFAGVATASEIIRETSGSRISREAAKGPYARGTWRLVTSNGAVVETRTGGSTFTIRPEAIGDGGYVLQLIPAESDQPEFGGFRLERATTTVRIASCGPGAPAVAEAKARGAAACKADGEEPAEECGPELEFVQPVFDAAPFLQAGFDPEAGLPQVVVNPEVFIVQDPPAPRHAPIDLLAECARLQAEIARRKEQIGADCAAPIASMLKLLAGPAEYEALRQRFVERAQAGIAEPLVAIRAAAAPLAAKEAELAALVAEAKAAGALASFESRFITEAVAASPEEFAALSKRIAAESAALAAERRAIDEKEQNSRLDPNQPGLNDAERARRTAIDRDLRRNASLRPRVEQGPNGPVIRLARPRADERPAGVPPTITLGGLSQDEFFFLDRKITDRAARDGKLQEQLARARSLRDQANALLSDHAATLRRVKDAIADFEVSLEETNEDLAPIHAEFAALRERHEAEKDRLAEMFASRRFEHCLGAFGPAGGAGFFSVAAGDVRGARDLARGLPGMNVDLPDPGEFAPADIRVEAPRPLTERALPGFEDVFPLRFREDGEAQLAREAQLFDDLADAEAVDRNSRTLSFLTTVSKLSREVIIAGAPISGELAFALSDAILTGRAFTTEEIARLPATVTEEAARRALANTFEEDFDLRNLVIGFDKITGANLSGEVPPETAISAGDFLEALGRSGTDFLRLLEAEERDRLVEDIARPFFADIEPGAGPLDPEAAARRLLFQLDRTKQEAALLELSFLALDAAGFVTGGFNAAKLGSLLDDIARASARGLLTETGRVNAANRLLQTLEETRDIGKVRQRLAVVRDEVGRLVRNGELPEAEAQRFLDDIGKAAGEAEVIAEGRGLDAIDDLVALAEERDDLPLDLLFEENRTRLGPFVNNEGALPEFGEDILRRLDERTNLPLGEQSLGDDLDQIARDLLNGEAFKDGAPVNDVLRRVDGDAANLGPKLGAGQNSTVFDGGETAFKVVDRKVERAGEALDRLQAELARARAVGEPPNLFAVADELKQPVSVSELEFEFLDDAGKAAARRQIIDDLTLSEEGLDALADNLRREALDQIQGSLILQKNGVPHQRVLGVGERETEVIVRVTRPDGSVGFEPRTIRVPVLEVEKFPEGAFDLTRFKRPDGFFEPPPREVQEAVLKLLDDMSRGTPKIGPDGAPLRGPDGAILRNAPVGGADLNAGNILIVPGKDGAPPVARLVESGAIGEAPDAGAARRLNEISAGVRQGDDLAQGAAAGFVPGTNGVIGSIRGRGSLLEFFDKDLIETFRDPDAFDAAIRTADAARIRQRAAPRLAELDEAIRAAEEALRAAPGSTALRESVEEIAGAVSKAAGGPEGAGQGLLLAGSALTDPPPGAPPVVSLDPAGLFNAGPEARSLQPDRPKPAPPPGAAPGPDGAFRLPPQGPKVGRLINPLFFVREMIELYRQDTIRLEIAFLQRCLLVEEKKDEGDDGPIPPFRAPEKQPELNVGEGLDGLGERRTVVSPLPQPRPAAVNDPPAPLIPLKEELVEIVLDSVDRIAGFNPFDRRDVQRLEDATFRRASGDDGGDDGGGGDGGGGATGNSFTSGPIACIGAADRFTLFFNAATNRVEVDELSNQGIRSAGDFPVNQVVQTLNINTVLPVSQTRVIFSVRVDRTADRFTVLSLTCVPGVAQDAITATFVGSLCPPPDRDIIFSLRLEQRADGTSLLSVNSTNNGSAPSRDFVRNGASPVSIVNQDIPVGAQTGGGTVAAIRLTGTFNLGAVFVPPNPPNAGLANLVVSGVSCNVTRN